MGCDSLKWSPRNGLALILFFGIIAVICTQVIYGALFQANLCRMKAAHHIFRCQSSIFPFEILWAIDLPFWLPLGPHISKCQWSKLYHEDTGGCLRLIITVNVNIVLYMDDKRNWECHCYIWCLKVVFSLYLRWAQFRYCLFLSVLHFKKYQVCHA